MPLNRKYLPEEINYVLSRTLAGWKPEVIAENFKRDHARHWRYREFTKKQVSYIKNTYKITPGSIQPYRGPEPQPSLVASPLTQLLFMAPTHHETGQSSINEALAPSMSRNWSVGQQSSFNATSATGSAAANSYSTQANIANLSESAHGNNAPFHTFGDAGSRGGVQLNPNADVFRSNVFNNVVPSTGDHLTFGDMPNSAMPPVLTAEDQSLLDNLLPFVENEQQAMSRPEISQNGNLYQQHQQHRQKTNAVQSVASTFQSLSTGDGSANEQLRQDTIMQPIEREVDGNEDSDKENKTPTSGIALELSGNGGGASGGDRSSSFDMNATPMAAPRTVQQPRGIDFYFGPHGHCRIEREHGHNTDDGSVIFRSETKFHESLIAMQEDKAVAYFMGLSDGIAQGMQSAALNHQNQDQLEQANNVNNHHSAGLNSAQARAVASVQLHPALEQAYRGIVREQADDINSLPRQTQGHSANGIPWNRNLQGPNFDPEKRSRPAPAWKRHPLPNYYDVFTGDKLDYQGISLGPGSSIPQHDNSEGSSTGAGIHQQQQQQQQVVQQPTSAFPYHQPAGTNMPELGFPALTRAQNAHHPVPPILRNSIFPDSDDTTLMSTRGPNSGAFGGVSPHFSRSMARMDGGMNGMSHQQRIQPSTHAHAYRPDSFYSSQPLHQLGAQSPGGYSDIQQQAPPSGTSFPYPMGFDDAGRDGNDENNDVVFDDRH